MTTKRLLWVGLLTCLLVGCGKTPPPRSGGRTVGFWVEALQGQDVEQRRKAAVKIGPLFKDKAVLPALLAALKDPDAEVRLAAARSLGIFSGAKAPEVLPHLREVEQQDADPNVRAVAGKAIEMLGK